MIRERGTHFEYAYTLDHLTFLGLPAAASGGPHYPDCGCDSEDHCMHCTWCGSCIRNQEYCPCLSVQDDDDSGFDMFRETCGG